MKIRKATYENNTGGREDMNLFGVEFIQMSNIPEDEIWAVRRKSIEVGYLPELIITYQVLKKFKVKDNKILEVQNESK